MTLAEALRAGAARLTAAGIEGAAGDARALLCHATGLAPGRLTLHLPDTLSSEAEERFGAALIARAARQPVAQIIGQRLFWGRSFRVTPDVLDPRPETEVLVAAALEAPFTRVLDLGTGSGAILLSLLADRPLTRGIGVDVSPAALAVAQGNATALGLAVQAELRLSDWFAAVPETGFDLIVSNPPYIADDEMAGLAPEVRDWEPHLALTPGGDGLDAYRAIAAGAGSHLAPGGRLMVEIGPTQGAAVTGLFRAAGLRDVAIRVDLDGRDRVVIART
jgi:release factor glutamine methyltransferase